ncbi:PEP/pyruvate-binding domain-containing protein [Maribacter polysaccharolyticus]|uniref:PEP/pyruvate-binding domain-containing protein n=1 Tax=Maribacter polysaccharolyticus TaxID=3020831 RepID=UPI00237F42EC|nr:PEP/pyruvate-binding domain-containing protein [Maribacter polysaccharolyticus]MDE3741701.1 PEP/pyruvate-binding domain-containing protein [Maribacter polysaccharolyticus]
MCIKNFCVVIFVLGLVNSVWSQKEIPVTKLVEQVARYKGDVRGPYKDIRWFCADGSIRAPKDPCPDNIGPGVQHARYKDEVVTLGNEHHIYLGQILAYTDVDAFWDADFNHSRLKQYQLEKYLKSVDNGWILQKGQFYRGSVQVEDEEAWGIAFYKWLLAKDDALKRNYFLIRQSLKDIPHSGDDDVAQKMRSQSKVISDEFLPFMDLRVKIHGQPEVADIAKVKNFQQKYRAELSSGTNKKIDDLIATMTIFFKPVDIAKLEQNAPLLKGTPLGNSIERFMADNGSGTLPSILISDASQLLYKIRDGILSEKRPLARLQLLDVSLKLEEIIFKNAQQWEPKSLKEQLEKICYLGTASTGAGYLELWEWEQLEEVLSQSEKESMSLAELTTFMETARGAVEWSAAMVKANYQEVVNMYAQFEPLAYGFIDDRIRGSIALHLGKSVGELGDFMAIESAISNAVMDIPGQSTLRGLNPGYAFGELVVVSGSPEAVEVSSDKIYVFQRSPSDLKPVAGIATVAEGNMVSHVQLLARNLGIPNAALSDENLQSLKRYNGQKVFYAVSGKGNVIIKPEAQMTSQEQGLFVKKERSSEKIEVPVGQIRLDQRQILNLRNVDAHDSGKLCGPKAANLGQLKKMFPDKVVEGLVIPFGIFREHMDQEMPGRSISYWQFLNDMFDQAEKMVANRIPEAEIEKYQLDQLATLREAIKKMPLKTDFLAQLNTDFKTVLGQPLGEIPVFLRSDTNMEDLKEFTGAGLNLTLFNVLDRERILNGIKDVWASPYTERSFKWRQKYLLNPENVFPSILVIPSVDVDYSGVLITKGINSGAEKDLTIAFSRGAGGAVDGQSAETYTVFHDGGYRLLAPARETYYNRLPNTGGIGKKSATFEKPIINARNMNDIKELAQVIRTTLPEETESDYIGAYDVELGFQDDKLWLFQIRPFVENKKALSSEYLESITPKMNMNKEIPLSKKLQ